MCKCMIDNKLCNKKEKWLFHNSRYDYKKAFFIVIMLDYDYTINIYNSLMYNNL